MKQFKKVFLSLLVIFALVVQMLPMSSIVNAASNDVVKVIVENTTFTQPVDGNTPAWTGRIVDTTVERDGETNAMVLFKKALDKEGISYTESSGYVSNINGLREYDGGNASGWMVTINDWFTDTGISQQTVGANDEIKFMYTRSYGSDLGGSWYNRDKTLKALDFSAGKLSPVFSKTVKKYNLTLPEGTESVVVTPTASNKNYQVRTSVGDTEYKRIVPIPVKEGTVITVKCGDPSWPSMNNGQYGNGSENVPAETYEITVTYKKMNVTFDDGIDSTEDIVKAIEKDLPLDYMPKAPVKEGYTFVGWYKDVDDITTEYKNNQTYQESVTYKAKYAHFEMLGAQAKQIVDNKSGLRFGTKIYNDGDKIVEKGTLIIPIDLLLEETDIVKLDTPKVAKSVGKTLYEVNEDENYVTYLGTLSNMPKSQFNRAMTASSYVTYQDKAGNEYTVYSPYKNLAISVLDLIGNSVDWNEEW